MIQTALALAARGFHIFPCRPRDKRPATANGLKDATTDPDIIQAWWQQQPDNNIAIATGAASGIFVVDVDGLDAEATLRRLEAEHGALPATVEVITARGRHVYFKWPQEPVRNSAGKIGAHIDIRGDGGYVLCPPSIHPSGRRYSWSVDSADHIAEAPGWLLAKQNGVARQHDAIPGMAIADRGRWRRRTELQPCKARGPSASPSRQCLRHARPAAGLERHQLQAAATTAATTAAAASAAAMAATTTTAPAR